MKVFPGILVSLALLSVAILAADKKSGNNKSQKLSPGDKVEVEWAGKMVKAEVVEFSRTGWVTVRFQSNGITMTPTLPPDRMRPIARKPAGAGKSSDSKLRIWTDSTGKHKTKARFIELKEGQVTLETEEGKTMKLALDKLSDADQEVAREAAKQAEENPFKTQDDQKGEENPFESATESSDDSDSQEQKTDVDWSDVQTVLMGTPGEWSLKPDAAPDIEKLASKPIPLGSTSKSSGRGNSGFFETVDGLLFARGPGKACAVIRDGTPGKTPEVRLQMIDLARGKAQAAIPYGSSMKPVDIDPAGEQILARSDHMFSRGDSTPGVSIWKINEKGVRLVRSWNPHDPDNFHTTAPSYAQFIDADHLVTLSFPGKLTMWQISDAKAIYRMELSGSGVPALSANRKYLAAPVNNGMYLFEALTGEMLGKLPGDPGVVSAMSFRPDGKQLAALSPQRLIVWDLEKGELYRDIFFSKQIPATAIDWLQPGYLMVSGENLIDLERRIVLWTYQHEAGRGFARGFGEIGGSFWYVLTINRDRKERALFQSRLPHDEALKKANGLNVDQLLAVKPGVQISLDVNVQGSPDEQQNVVQSLTAQLSALGINVANGSPLVLQARTETGKSREIAYRSFGRSRRTAEKATITEQISRLKFIENGKVLWEAVSIGGAPHLLKMKEGENLQQALARYQKPNLEFFAAVKVPQYVARPSDAGAYGASNLTPQGIQAAPLVPQQPAGGDKDKGPVASYGPGRESFPLTAAAR